MLPKVKTVLIIAFLSLILLLQPFTLTHYIPKSYAQILDAKLFRTPIDVYSMQPVLIFAYSTFKDLSLKVTIDIETSTNVTEALSLANPIPITTKVKMVPAGWGKNWYLAGIAGLPAITEVIEREVKTGLLKHTERIEIKITSIVSYTLLVNGKEIISDSYTVKEGEITRRLPPLVSAMVYDVIKDPELIAENLGLGPKGWSWSSQNDMKLLIITIDDKGASGIEEQKFEYKVNEGNWIEAKLLEDPKMNVLKDLISKLNVFLEQIEESVKTLNPNFDLPLVSLPLMISSSVIPAQKAGSYVMFRATAKDTDGNLATSPTGLYYTINEKSDTKILIIDPHIWLWLFQENLEQFLERFDRNMDYSLPEGLTEEIKPSLRIAQIIKENGFEPFHHWEYLSENYNIYIAYPNSDIANLLKSEIKGGYEPHTIILSNLWWSNSNSWDIK
jgi:hypothetical protein